MNKESLLSDLDVCTKNFVESLSHFTTENFNRQPSETEWSAAQVAEHLLLLEIIANKVIRGESIPTNRPPDQKIALIKWAMENETKRVAPEMVLPSGKQLKPQELIEQIFAERNKLKEAIAIFDMTDACTSFKHPGIGTLTRWEWVYFTIYHTERHLKQVNRLLANATP